MRYYLSFTKGLSSISISYQYEIALTLSEMDDGKYLNWIVNATKLTNEEWHSISGDTWHCSDRKDMIWVFVVLGCDLKLFVLESYTLDHNKPKQSKF